jgi:uncharacterized protein YecE (DUF72 family)
MQLYVGTSGWIYSDWVGPFYPEKLKQLDKLAFYAKEFQTVEINSTFYHMPQEVSVQRWAQVVPKDFCFAIKLNRYLTHTKHLVADDDFDETLQDFLRRIHHLGDKLGIVLVQLPPSMKIDLSRLEHLARQRDKAEKHYNMRFPIAVEFRNDSWFTNEVFACLNRCNFATVNNDSPNRWPATRRITGDTAYIRMHGSKRLYHSSYTDTELRTWAKFIKTDCANCKTVYVYFNNDYNATAVANARSLLRILQDG